MILEAKLRLRVSQQDVHYAGNLVDGAHLLSYFGDVATELLIRFDGDEGLFRAYESVEFLAPVYAGDFLEIVGRMAETGRTSRKIEFEAWKVITAAPKINETAAEFLASPTLVCRAVGTCVTPIQKQRISHHGN